MSKYETVLSTVDGAVATIAINRPDAMNSFNVQLRADLTAALRVAASDDAIRAVVLTGTGGPFSAGADLKAMPPQGQTVERQLQREYRPILDEIESMPKPVIAAIDGAAAGIGLSVALICDLAIMKKKAFFLAPFATIGLVPDGGATYLLQKQLGYKRAYQLCIEAERIDSQRALDWGLVNRVSDADSVVPEAQAWAAELAVRAPLSMAATKQSMRFAQAGSWADTFNLEAELQAQLLNTDDNAEGVAAFLEKRAPKFTGK